MWWVGTPPAQLSCGSDKSQSWCVGKHPRRSGVKGQSQVQRLVQSWKTFYRSAACNGNPWVRLSIKDFCLPAMSDSGLSVSFVVRQRQDMPVMGTITAWWTANLSDSGSHVCYLTPVRQLVQWPGTPYRLYRAREWCVGVVMVTVATNLCVGQVMGKHASSG
jgi:hypothetical protein